MKRYELSMLHDGNLRGLSVDTNRSMTLDCVSAVGDEVAIRIKCPLEFCAHNFRLGNIILSAEVAALQSIPDSYRRILLSGHPPHAWSEWEANGFQAFVLLGSFGCDAFAIVRSSEDVGCELLHNVRGAR